jgi:hypothetical protein
MTGILTPTLNISYLNPAHNRFPAHQTLLDAGGAYRAAGYMSTGLEQYVTLQVGAHQALVQSNTILPTWTISSSRFDLVTNQRHLIVFIHTSNTRILPAELSAIFISQLQWNQMVSYSIQNLSKSLTQEVS